jgi:hypothetical protein
MFALVLGGGALVIVGIAMFSPLGWLCTGAGVVLAFVGGQRLSRALKEERAFVLRTIERAKKDGFVEEVRVRKTWAQLLGLTP